MSRRVAINCFGLKSGCGGVASYFSNIVSAFLDGSLAWEPRLFHGEKNVAELDRVLPTGWQKHAVFASPQDMCSRGRQHAIYFAPLGPYYPNPVPLPTVITMADNQEVFFPHFFTDRQLMDRRRELHGSSLYCDAVITMSKYSAECLHKGYGVKRDKMQVCYAYLKESAPSQRPSAVIPERFIFYPANRWHHKNHCVLLEAIGYLRREKKASINLVCTGAEMKGGFDLNAAASQCGIADLVHDLGFVGNGEMTYLYQNAEALVFPSLYEGFGYPILEAMRLGCPVITSTAGSLPEVAGTAAIYFDPSSPTDLSEKLMCVWGNDQRKAGLVEAGRKQAEVFSQGNFVNAHSRAFADAIGNYSRLRFLLRRNISKRIREATIRIKEAMWGPRYAKPQQLPAMLP